MNHHIGVVLTVLIVFFIGRLWSVAHVHGYVTLADFATGRYGSRRTGYIGLTAFVLNAVIATALTLILCAAMLRDRADETTATDYFVAPPAGDAGSATAAAR